jgi:hypothetical protein
MMAKEPPAFTPNPDDPFPNPIPQPPPIPIPDPFPERPLEPPPQLPPDWWRCFRRGPVSGRYAGLMTAPRPGRSALDLRVDIDPRHANSPVMDRISGDFSTVYRQVWNNLPPFGWQVYRESWIVDNPAVQWSRCEVVITGSVRYYTGSHPATTVRVRIPWKSFTPAGPAEVTFTESGGSTFSYTCPRRSDCFRDVTLEADVAQSVNVAPLLPTYDTHAHPTRPAGLPRRALTFGEAYEEAGICVSVTPTHTVIDDSAPAFTAWSDAELHDALETHFSVYGPTPSWHVWGVMVGRHDDPDTAGIMFDYGTAYGGPGRLPERQGFAVFRGHPVFNGLPTGAPATDAEAEALRYFLYVWVHEAGHAFNFLHSWDKGRPDALSWMNYPQYVTDFWANFEFRFDDEELIHLRHGNRSEVIFGGDPWSTGGHLELPVGAMAHMEGNPPVELTVRSKDYFEYLEPVVVELRLRNQSPDLPIGADTRLAPEYGRTTLYVRAPDGRIRAFMPIIQKEGTEYIQILAPAGADVAGSDRYSENVMIAFDKHGFLFEEPGEYLIRASYQPSADMQVYSSLHRIRVGRPVSKEEDRLAQDVFRHEVGMSLYLGGSQSPFLRTGMDRLEDLAERYPDSPVGAKAALIVANSIAKPFFRIDDPTTPKLTQAHAPDPARALKLTAPALEQFRKSDDPAGNLAYHQLVRSRVGYLLDQGKAKDAKQEMTTLLSDLGKRGVNASVLNDIEADTAAL